MSLVTTQLEYRNNNEETEAVPMDVADTYSMGSVEGGQRFVPDRIIAIGSDGPSVSTGVFSIGTNMPDCDDIVPPTAWNLYSLGENGSRSFPLLSGGLVSVEPEANVYLKVAPGGSDVGGHVRVVLDGFLYPVA